MNVCFENIACRDNTHFWNITYSWAPVVKERLNRSSVLTTPIFETSSIFQMSCHEAHCILNYICMDVGCQTLQNMIHSSVIWILAFFFSCQQFKYAKISSKENGSCKKGVVFATYSSLIGESQSFSKYRTRLKQLLKWCGKDFEGVVSFSCVWSCHVFSL